MQILFLNPFSKPTVFQKNIKKHSHKPGPILPLLIKSLHKLKPLTYSTNQRLVFDKTCVVVATASSASEDDTETQNDSEEESLNVISKVFDDEEPLAINKIRHWSPSTPRNFYPRPTPPDLQYEERGSVASASFDRHFIHTWNIDGKSEHEILSTL